MDWLKWFALLLTVASFIMAEGPKKKIRIHLPQKVKHIHHHKKIYITNHSASPQYAPAYMPSAEGAVAVPTNVANIVPFNSLYEDSQVRLPRVSTPGSKLLPMYRARGYYGPNNSDWEEQEYDLVPPAEPNESAYIPTAFAAPTGIQAPPPHRSPKRVKLLKMNEPKHKIIGRKPKPQHIVVRSRPHMEDEHPVSTFHEKFYSDLDGTGTIRKIKKPQRVEKIVDGDTEHIHTYSEEHIHKLIYDNPKVGGVVGADQISSMSGLNTAHRIIPFKHPQTLIAFHSENLPSFPSIGSMGTPTLLEYAAYNPRDVTHDHIFHDHGEIPAHIDIAKDPLSIPPKISYNSQGSPIGGMHKGFRNKYSHKYSKHLKETPSSDLSYYESIFTPYNRHKKILKPTIPPPQYDTSGLSIEDYSLTSTFNQKEKGNTKTRDLGAPFYFNSAKQNTNNHSPQANFPSPFSVSSSVVHEYKPKNYANNLPVSLDTTKFKDSLTNFKDNSYSNHFEYDALASPSNVLTSEDKHVKPGFRNDKKKSISSQNINFGGLDHQTTIDHQEDFGISAISANDEPLSFLEDYNNSAQSNIDDSVTSTPFTIKDTSPVHPYYSAMAIKALHGDEIVAEASNNNFRYVQMHNPSTTPHTTSAVTTINFLDNYKDEQTSNSVTLKPTEYLLQTKARHRSKNMNSEDINRQSRQKYSNMDLEFQKKNLNTDISLPKPPEILREQKDQRTIQLSDTISLKYGDKI